MMPAPIASLNCPKCRSPWPGALCNLPAPTPCPACGAKILVEVFPAMLRPADTGQAAEVILEEGASSCFYHEQKKAVIHCDGCGRFLCALCDVEFGGQHLCPTCLQSGKKKGRLATLDTSRILWDTAALFVCLVPILVWPVTIVSAPAAIGLAITSFFKPGSLVPRTRLRAVIAIVLALLQILTWVYFLFFHES